jgi:DNA-binding IclR family transcriptional regulator
MSSLTRMLGLLDLFDVDHPFWTSEQIMERTGYSRPTTFRYLKELRDAGLLARFGGGYTLGAKAARMDYVIRQSDPLVHLFDPILDRLRDRTDCDVIFVSLLGDEFFATIHKETRTSTSTQRWPRGRPMPLHKGAGGIAVLSDLPKTQLKRILSNPKITEAGVDIEQLQSEIDAAKKQGHAISFGAIDPEHVGVAVPVSLKGVPPAALIVAMDKRRFPTTDLTAILGLLNQAKREMLATYKAHAVQEEGKQ